MNLTKHDIERFNHLYIIEKQTGCWLWVGNLNKDGYGKFYIKRRVFRAHRIAHIIYVGEIPEDNVLDHLCRKRSCVNPYHLEITSPLENTLRGNAITMINKKKKYCLRGHPLLGDNVRIYQNRRYCKTCDRMRHRRRS